MCSIRVVMYVVHQYEISEHNIQGVPDKKDYDRNISLSSECFKLPQDLFERVLLFLILCDFLFFRNLYCCI